MSAVIEKPKAKLATLAEEFERIKRHLAALEQRKREIEQAVEAEGIRRYEPKGGVPPVDGKWDVGPFTVSFCSRVDMDTPTARRFVEQHPEYSGVLEQKWSARKAPLLKALAGAPPALRKELRQAFKLKPSKPRISVKPPKE